MNPFYNTCAWRDLSRHVRFGRALGYCEICGVPHGAIAADGRSVIRLGCAHLNGDLHDLRPENLAAFCPRCHFLYDEFRRVATLVREHPELRELLEVKLQTPSTKFQTSSKRRKRMNHETAAQSCAPLSVW